MKWKSENQLRMKNLEVLMKSHRHTLIGQLLPPPSGSNQTRFAFLRDFTTRESVRLDNFKENGRSFRSQGTQLPTKSGSHPGQGSTVRRDKRA